MTREYPPDPDSAGGLIVFVRNPREAAFRLPPGGLSPCSTGLQFPAAGTTPGSFYAGPEPGRLSLAAQGLQQDGLDCLMAPDEENWEDVPFPPEMPRSLEEQINDLVLVNAQLREKLARHGWKGEGLTWCHARPVPAADADASGLLPDLHDAGQPAAVRVLRLVLPGLRNLRHRFDCDAGKLAHDQEAGMTVWPNDDGTLIVIDELGEREMEEWEVEADELFSAGDKAFLRSMFRHAVPMPVACRVPPPAAPD